ncbi:MAG: hypothetical protein Q4A83_03790 [Bacillota bacterium]|nr:hypothetical protein [Bacillota bacterium]
MDKIRYNVNGKSLLVRLAAVLMLLSAMFRVMGYWGFWKEQTECFGYMQILLPIVCNIAFAVMILYFGEKCFSLTLIPVLMGVAFFVVKATDMKVFPMLVCVIVSVLAGVIYLATVFGIVKTKWLLAAVIGVPLLYQLIIRDGATILAKENAMTMDEFIPELSILCILLSLLLVVFAMKKRKPEELEAVNGEIFGDEYIAEDAKDKNETENAALPEEKTETSLEEKQE